MSLKDASFKPTCKLCGKHCESHYAYYHHIDIDHAFNPQRKYELEHHRLRMQRVKTANEARTEWLRNHDSSNRRRLSRKEK